MTSFDAAYSLSSVFLGYIEERGKMPLLTDLANCELLDQYFIQKSRCFSLTVVQIGDLYATLLCYVGTDQSTTFMFHCRKVKPNPAPSLPMAKVYFMEWSTLKRKNLLEQNMYRHTCEEWFVNLNRKQRQSGQRHGKTSPSKETAALGGDWSRWGTEEWLSVKSCSSGTSLGITRLCTTSVVYSDLTSQGTGILYPSIVETNE